MSIVIDGMGTGQTLIDGMGFSGVEVRTTKLLVSNRMVPLFDTNIGILERNIMTPQVKELILMNIKLRMK